MENRACDCAERNRKGFPLYKNKIQPISKRLVKIELRLLVAHKLSQTHGK
jgi:hypothetical protein